MSDEDKYIEVKVWSAKLTAYDAKKIIKQAVSILLCHGGITKGAKKLLNDAGIQYRENICSNELKFLFMNGWNYGKSIVVRSPLLKDIVTTQYFSPID